MIKAVLIGQQGCGTNLLRAFLNSHPDMVFEAEHFCPGRPFNKFKQSGKSIPDFLSDFYGSHKGKKVVGFDLKYNQCEPAILKWLDEHNVKVVHMYRNPGRTALRMLNEKNPTLTLEQLNEHCQYVKKWREKIRHIFAGDNDRYKVITYEELTGGYDIYDWSGPLCNDLQYYLLKGQNPVWRLTLDDKYATKPLKIRF